MRHLFLVLAIPAIMASFLNTYALLSDNLSDEDKKEAFEILNDINSIEVQETEEEWRDYLEEHREFIRSLIKRISCLMYKYPHVTFIQKLKDSRDYLRDLIVHYELF
jgi:uncharacterized protein YgfB (UPF0149 family)